MNHIRFHMHAQQYSQYPIVLAILCSLIVFQSSGISLTPITYRGGDWFMERHNVCSDAGNCQRVTHVFMDQLTCQRLQPFSRPKLVSGIIYRHCDHSNNRSRNWNVVTKTIYPKEITYFSANLLSSMEMIELMEL